MDSWKVLGGILAYHVSHVHTPVFIHTQKERVGLDRVTCITGFTAIT